MKKSLSLPFLLAFRFVRGATSEQNIAVMVKICFFSILCGTFGLTMVAAIMNGFEKATQEKLQGINADALIRSSTGPINTEKLTAVLQNEFGSVIQATSPNSCAQLIIQNDYHNKRFQQLIAIKGIDPLKESHVTALATMLIHGSRDLACLSARNSIIIGQALAASLHIKTGDTVTLLFPTESQIEGKQISLDARSAAVIALFKTGIEEFDEHMVYSSLDFFNDLFDTGVTQIAVKFKENVPEEQVVAQLKTRLTLEVYSWKELYPAIVSALTLEKYVMFIILTLMTLVLSINVIALLFMFISQKRGEIALLKAMGMADNTLVVLFISLGMIITIGASFLGVLFAWIVCLLLSYYPIALPDAYYVSYLPAQISWSTIAILSAIIIMVSLLATWFPAYRTRFIKLAQVLKTEH